MASTITEPALNPVGADADITRSILTSVHDALAMCDMNARCVGVASVPSHDVGRITGLIGIHGKVSGFVTVNMAEQMAIKMVEGLLQESYGTLTPQVVDGAGEITNIIVGGIKSSLAKSPWGFGHITVPSVIVGSGYSMTYAPGLEYLCVTFELAEKEVVMLEDRLIQVAVSFLRL